MKKTQKIMKIFVLLAALMLLVLSACAKENKKSYNMFSTICEQSEINWYLTHNYGQDVPSQCNYYEFIGLDRYCMLVEIAKNDSASSYKTDTVPEYAFFSYEGDSVFPQDPRCFDIVSVETLTNQEAPAYKLTPDVDAEHDTGISALYIMYGKTGIVERLLVEAPESYNMLFCYQYNSDGLVNALYVQEGGEAYDTFFADSVSYNDWLKTDFQYNEDGSLAEITHEDGTCKFAYKNGKRSYAVFESQYGEGAPEETDKASYVRNDDGLAEEVTIMSYGEKVSCKINYYDDGTAEADYSSDETTPYIPQD